MRIRSAAGRLAQWGMVPILAAAVAVGVAQGPQDRGNGHGNDNHSDRGNRDRGDHGRGDQGRGDQNRGNDFRFRDQDRDQFQSRYRKDLNRWRRRPQARPSFQRGQRIPSGYRFQPVPRAYYANVPPPPVGYQYGYYDGYVVAYNPTTRIIADVLDLVTATTR